MKAASGAVMPQGLCPCNKRRGGPGRAVSAGQGEASGGPGPGPELRLPASGASEGQVCGLGHCLCYAVAAAELTHTDCKVIMSLIYLLSSLFLPYLSDASSIARAEKACRQGSASPLVKGGRAARLLRPQRDARCHQVLASGSIGRLCGRGGGVLGVGTCSVGTAGRGRRP